MFKFSGIVDQRAFSRWNLVEQISKLHVNAPAIASSNSIGSKRKNGNGFLSYASTNFWLLNVSKDDVFPIFEQRRFRKFIPEWRFNWRFKQPHSPAFRCRPQHKYDYSQLEGKEYTHLPFYMKWLNGVNPETGEWIV